MILEGLQVSLAGENSGKCAHRLRLTHRDAAYQPKDDNSVLVEDPKPVVQRLAKIINIVQLNSANHLTGPNFKKLICGSFAILIEGSIHDRTFWSAVMRETKFDQLIRALLLEESQEIIRTEILERIRMICAPSKSPKQADAPQNEGSRTCALRSDMLAFIWQAIAQSIPEALAHATQCAEFFKAALCVFRSVAERSPQDVTFGQDLREWGEVMLRHRTDEV